MDFTPFAEFLTACCRRMEAERPEAAAPEAPWHYCAFAVEPSDGGHDATGAMFGGQGGDSVEFALGSDPALQRHADAFITALDELVDRVAETRVQVEFSRRPGTQVLIAYSRPSGWSATGSPERFALNGTIAPELIRDLYDLWSLDTEEERRAQRHVRTPHESFVEIERSIGLASEDIEIDRSRLIAAVDTEEGDVASAAYDAEDGTLRVHARLFELMYERGDGIESLRDHLDVWHRDTLLAFRVLEARAGTAAFTTAMHGNEFRAVRFSSTLVLLATVLGRADIARSVLAHPAISHAPFRPIDVLALIHDVPQDSELDADRFPIWREVLEETLWLRVAKLTPGRRQAAFEKLVRTWRTSLEKRGSVPGTPWAWGAALLAVLFDLDDSEVHNVPEYPSALVDMARAQGVPPAAPAGIRLPGPWKKPSPPKVIEPEVRRDPSTISGDVTRADLAALLTPVGGEPLGATSFDALLAAALEEGTAMVLDWRGADADELGGSLQLACKRLGLPAPGSLPSRLPVALEKALPRVDAALEAVGARLIEIGIDSDDPVFVPVLPADHEAVIGARGEGFQLRSIEQFAADNDPGTA